MQYETKLPAAHILKAGRDRDAQVESELKTIDPTLSGIADARLDAVLYPWGWSILLDGDAVLHVNRVGNALDNDGCRISPLVLPLGKFAKPRGIPETVIGEAEDLARIRAVAERYYSKQAGGFVKNSHKITAVEIRTGAGTVATDHGLIKVRINGSGFLVVNGIVQPEYILGLEDGSYVFGY